MRRIKIEPRLSLAVSALLTFSTQVAADPLSFSGPYAGAFGGYGFGVSSQHDNGFVYVPPVPPAPPAPVGGEGGINLGNADGNYGLHGAVGGGLFGYAMPVASFVAGLEADVAASSIKGRSFFCGTPAHECGTSVGVTGDVRARIGLPYGQFMPFIAGGLAVADIGAYDTLFRTGNSSGRAGYTIGGGVEYKLMPQLSLRLEYLHSDFGTRAMFNIVPGVPERIAVRTDVVRAGLTYSFSVPPPVVARY